MEERKVIAHSNREFIELRIDQSNIYNLWFFTQQKYHVIYINGFSNGNFRSDVKFNKKFIEPWLPYFTQEAAELLAEWVNIMEAERNDFI